ncbi:hypothetical protein E1B28_001586 [Marasmius oreades]|uniref:Eukaryotic mitochondrial regulator protein-domain-containing protein n=1 Tax=Marasmius oreades TaxID=181124 RepID=A0A9P7V3P5_9AGAR|nr:uncharacterized protein E1B28_001586 [Marasmius oreades]KAG7099774.1 hypothetical protein E1B28_001586 [Marasmius oreades]
MSLHRCFFRSSQTCLWFTRPICQRRALSYTLPRPSDSSPEPAALEELVEAEEIDEAFEAQMAAAEAEDTNPSLREGDDRTQSYRNFMSTVAEQYKFAGPRQWLGREGPFPLNRSFKPPPPLQDALKNRIYEEYMQDPIVNNLRALSQRYHISLKRVDAILRLKGMEQTWIKGKPIQTGFVRGMERILNVDTSDSWKNDPPTTYRHPRYETTQADALEEAENRDAARQRYQRSYWESTPEHGGEPIVPAALEHAKRMAIRMSEKAKKEKDARYISAIADTDSIKWPKESVVISKREGRPDVHFIDVGAKFVNPLEEDKRLAKAATRARTRSREKPATPLLS